VRDNRSRGKRTADQHRSPIRREHAGPPTRVLILTNDFISSEGIAAIIRRDSRLVLCAAVQTPAEAEKLLASHRADLVVLEEPLVEDVAGLLWIRSVGSAFPSIRIVTICRHVESAYAERAIRAGVSGWCVRNGSPEGLLQTMRSVVGSEPAPISVSRFAKVSDRELEVFSLIEAGYGITDIARRLGISRKTVETHCEHLKQKLNYASAQELMSGARGLLGSVQ
jgi:DNA-binding NarL/FixJ family response regulator